MKNEINKILLTIPTSNITQHIRAQYKNLYNSIIDITPFIAIKMKFTARIYCILNDITEHPKCEYCHKGQLKFRSMVEGFKRYCSYKCMANSKTTREKYKSTCLEKYGVENPLQNIEIKNKVKQTNLERYGHECSLQNEKVKEKSFTSMQKKYGVNHALQSKEIQERIAQTCLNRYGTENPAQNSEIKLKIGLKSRERIRKQIEKEGKVFCPNIGKNEVELLNEQELIDNCIIDRKFTILGYYPDGYCKETNTIYEVYEKYHYTPKQITKDKIRQERIQSYLNCTFIIIKDVD